MAFIRLTKFSPRHYLCINGLRINSTDYSATITCKIQSIKETIMTPSISGSTPRSGAYIHWKRSNNLSLLCSQNNTRIGIDLQRTRTCKPLSLTIFSYSQCFPNHMKTMTEPAPFNLCFWVVSSTTLPAKTNQEAPPSRASHKMA